MNTRELLLAFGGGFFLLGLLCGVWKYAHIMRSQDAQAPVYVDVAHRAALMYAFSTMLLAHFVEASQLSERVEFYAVLVQVVFFALALGTYVVHGVLRDTDNQLAKPHRLGTREVPGGVIKVFMAALIAAEIGGFCVLLWGALVSGVAGE